MTELKNTRAVLKYQKKPNKEHFIFSIFKNSQIKNTYCSQ